MKNLTVTLSVLFIFFFAMTTSYAQQKKEFSGSLLWKVSGKDLSKPSYILGTHHLAHVSFVDSIAGLKDVISSTEQTVGELLMSDQASMQAKMQQAMFLPEGESYDKLLSGSDYAVVDAGLKKMMGAGLEQLGKMKPGFLSMMYTVMLYTKIYPEFNPMSHEAIDAYVQRIAKENNKSILGLETIDDQIYAIFDATPLKEQAESFACAMRTEDKAKESLDKLNAFYYSGNLAGMYQLAFNNPDDECKASKEQENAINKNRNDKWLVKLPQIMKDKSSLVAVGALHLAGNDGLLYQLDKMGYKVEPVK